MFILAGCGGSGSDTPVINDSLGESVTTAPQETRFITFESGQVRPLALSANGNKLFATNTPNGRLYYPIHVEECSA